MLGDGRVIHSERMRESDGALDVHARAFARAPHGAGEIAEAVGGKQRRLIERRNVERAGQVRAMVLDAMELRAQALDVGVEGLGHGFGDADELLEHLGAFAGKARHAQGVEQLGAEPGPGIARHGDVVHVGDGDAGFLQAVANRRDREARRVLDAIEALLFDRGDELAVLHQGRRGVAVVGVDAKNIHRKDSPNLFPAETRLRGPRRPAGVPVPPAPASDPDDNVPIH